MTDTPTAAPNFPSALRFWERGRLLYNAILMAVVMLWLALTWPHFRPSLTLGSLEAMLFLALMANLCYSAAYLTEFFLQPFVPAERWPGVRRALWTVGMLFALVLENYWIADEIYPAADHPPQPFFGGTTAMPIATNMNFPAPLAALGFLGAAIGLVLAIAAIVIFWLARKPKFARIAAIAIGAGAVTYLALLFGLSVSSRATMLARGQEKYFCEFDCHLAYSVADAHSQPDGRLLVTLRTRFDETTTSPSRPKDATLTPSPRDVRLIDSAGHIYTPISIEGTPLLTPLKPADSYTTQLVFTVPKDATALKFLVTTTAAWPDHIVIGDENSWLHKKTYFAL